MIVKSIVSLNHNVCMGALHNVDMQIGSLNVQGSQGASLGQLSILTTITSVRNPLHFRLLETKGKIPWISEG